MTTYPTFRWAARVADTYESEFVGTRHQFADGYSQDVPMGFNSERRKLNVTFSGYPAQVDEVIAFLRERQGLPFHYTPGLDAPGLFKCVRFSGTHEGGRYRTLSMQFEEAFR